MKGLVLLALCVATTVVLNAADPFVGTYKFNPATSTMVAHLPRRR